MKYQHVVNNITKLMEFWGLSINDLSKESGVSLTGLKKMMETGLFKLESLEKIANVFNVSTFILIADEVSILKKTVGEGESITVTYKFEDASKVTVLNDGKKLTTLSMMANNNFDYQEDKIQELEQKVFDIEEEMESKVQAMELTIERKNEMIEALNTKANLYKEQAEAFKLMNQQIMNTFLDKSNNAKSPE